MNKKKIEERIKIFKSPPIRPYGAKITLELEEDTKFPIEGECVLLTSPSYLLRVSPNHQAKNANQQSWNIFIEGFATAGEAEQAGLRVALGFFWAAVQGRYAIRLKYHTSLPCMVYDRNKPSGTLVQDFAAATIVKGINNVVNPIDQVLGKNKPLDPRLLVAIELFASARLETTERSKFVGLVSSLEPIATQDKIELEEFSKLVKEFKEKVSLLNIDELLKSSLKERREQLKRESVARAINKLVVKCLPDDAGALSIIKDAYNVRSSVLHDGSTDADLSAKSTEVESVIRGIFEHLILEDGE